MKAVDDFLNQLSAVVWGPAMLAFLLGVGIFLTIGLKAFPWRYTVKSFVMLWKGR